METEQYFHEAFDNMERLGPGSTASTHKAAGLDLSPKPPIKIFDIGSGAGIAYPASPA